MEIGHPGLVDKLVARITQDGPLSFADFMEAALYDPEFGYYMTPGPRIGRAGDYYTSLDVHPVFAELIGRQVVQAAEMMSLHGDFTIVEMGAGKGLLAGHLLDSYQRANPAFLSRIRYILVERSPAMVCRSSINDFIRREKKFEPPLDFRFSSAVVTNHRLNRLARPAHEIRTIYTTTKPPVNRKASVVCGHSIAGNDMENA